MGQAQINVRTRACSRTSIARTRQAALTPNVRGKELILLACTQSVDNLFHALMVLCENEYFLTSNLLCSFTSVKLCPLRYYNFLDFEKKISESIFS